MSKPTPTYPSAGGLVFFAVLDELAMIALCGSDRSESLRCLDGGVVFVEEGAGLP